MRPRISSNAGDILRRMKRRPALVTRELSAAAVKIKFVLVGESRKVLTEFIYSVPIPEVTRRKQKVSEHPQFSLETRREVGHRFEARKRAKKEKLWKQSGALLGRETGFTRGPVVYLVNPMGYAAARWALGTPEGRQIRSPGVKSVQWHLTALDRQREYIRKLRREALIRAFTVR